MKTKTIKKIIATKFNAWANSITDESLRKLVMDNTIITGGCIVSLLLGEDVNDFDLYFRNHETCLGVARYYGKQFPQGMVDIRDEAGRISIRVDAALLYKGEEEASDESPKAKEGEAEKYKPVFMSSNAITLTDKVQLVMRFYGEPEQIHANYDFIHCTSHWQSWDEALVTPEKALLAIMGKELFYVGSKYPLCSLIRIRKFVARKWTISAGQMLKIILQLNELDLQNIDVLREQIIGVDSAYFCLLLEALENAEPEKINAAYISAIIDRIF